MVVNYYQKIRERSARDVDELDLDSFFNLQAQQLTDREPIFFTRIVFCGADRKKNQETTAYNREISHLSQEVINYLRSEKWLLDYPEIFTINEINLSDPQLFAYWCPWGYTNNQPEYIQVIADWPLSANLQKYLQTAAILTAKYREICLNWNEQKVESQVLQEIVQNISHQLRNSLSLISLHTKNLWFVLKGNPAQAQAQVICDGVQNLDVSLTELIDCSRSQMPRLLPQDLRKLVDESIKNLQPSIQQKNLQISISETSLVLTVDRLQMQQVFDNLLSNAVHFSPQSGTITCSWQIFQGEVLINISDEGAGLSPEDLYKIFNPFYSRREGGTGLGLTIAKKIVLGHHGSLWAQNVKSGGARFSIILPQSL
jgi:signal transduction histidine kinase